MELCKFPRLVSELSRGPVTAVSNETCSSFVKQNLLCSFVVALFHHFSDIRDCLFVLSLVFETKNTEIEALVTKACQTNTAFFDTAERYGSHYKTALGLGWGETEQLLKSSLSKSSLAIQEDNSDTDESGTLLSPIVATKFTPSPWRTTVQSVIDACEESRNRLGVEQIDLYQLHMPDIVQPFRLFGKETVKDEIYWEGLAECYKRGLVRNVGVCNYGPTLVTRCQEALAKHNVPLASNQIGYSLVGRHNGAQATVDTCNELGIQVLAYFPFAMGILTGKYTSNDAENPTHMAEKGLASLSVSQKTKLEEQDLKRYVNGDGNSIPTGGIRPLLSVMEQIAQARDKTVAQVALNYIICKGAIPIPGARTEQQLVDNIGSMGWRLSDAEVSLLEDTADSLGFGFDGAGFKRTSEKFVGYGVEKWSLA